MVVSVNLTAHLCKLMGTTPDRIVGQYPQGNALSVMDHRELHALKLASNHGDILHWLKIYGLTMNDYRKAVQDAMDEGVEVTYTTTDQTATHTVRSLMISRRIS